MLEKLTVSQCISSDYCKGYNDAVDKIPKWIDVNKRLPENDYEKHWKDRKRYLVITKPSGLMCVAKFGYKEYDWWIDSHDCVLTTENYKKVTHWMPLPEPPKERGADE